MPNQTKKKKKKQYVGGQSPQGAQAPQGGRSTFGRKDSVFMPNIKKKPLKRALVGKQKNLPENIKKAIKAAPTKRTGVGSKSTKQKIKEYGRKQKQKEFEETQLNAQSSNPGSSSSNVKSAPKRKAAKRKAAMKPSPGKTPTAASKKAGLSTLKKSPAKRFCGGKSKPFKRIKKY